MDQSFVAEKTITTGVTGKTIINHKLRLRFNLSLMEYIMLDFVHNWSIEHPQKSFEDDDVWRFTGYHLDTDSKTVLALLRQKGMIKIVSSDFYYYEACDAWKKEFDVESDFEEFWEAWEKVGNKQKSKIMYLRARKVAEKEVLLLSALKYIAYRKKQFSEHTTHASSFLNPANKMWEDKLPDTKPEKPKVDPNEKQKFNWIK